MNDRELCSVCGGNGVVKIHHGVSVCAHCKGDSYEPEARAAQTPAEQEDSLLNPVSQVYFRAGLIACREYMARFVEAESPQIAMSIRANWWPSLGPDFGAPRKIDFHELADGEYGTERFRCKTAAEVSPTLEALPIALAFLGGREPQSALIPSSRAPLSEPQAGEASRTAAEIGFSAWWVCFRCWQAYHVPTTGYYGKCQDCGHDTQRWPADPAETLRLIEWRRPSKAVPAPLAGEPALPPYVSLVRREKGGVQIEGHTREQDWELEVDECGNVVSYSNVDDHPNGCTIDHGTGSDSRVPAPPAGETLTANGGSVSVDGRLAEGVGR